MNNGATQMTNIAYYPASWCAGYSGFVYYGYDGKVANHSYWMIPGTFFHDWDNR